MYSDLLEYAEKNEVPIILKEGLEFLLSSIKKYHVKSVLEIGTAIGYSAINMAEIVESVLTLERDPIMYNEAIKNIYKYDMSNKIKVVNIDALFFDTSEKFDLIFIDAAKSQNQKYFEIFSKNLNEKGIIIVDNLNFHGLVYQDDIKSKSLRRMVEKIKDFRSWLVNNSDFITEFTDKGDGMSLSKRK